MWLDDLYEDRKIRASANGSGRSRSLLQLFLSKKWWCDMDVYTQLKYSRKAPAVQLFFGWNSFFNGLLLHFCCFSNVMAWKVLVTLFCFLLGGILYAATLSQKTSLLLFLMFYFFNMHKSQNVRRKKNSISCLFFPYAPWDYFLFLHPRGLVHQCSWKLFGFCATRGDLLP